MKNEILKKPEAIWLITGGAMQRVAAEKIKKRGYVLIISDGSAECALHSIADEFLHIDIFDIQGNIAMADELKERYDIRAVFTTASDCHETVAHAARHLGLHGIDPAISRLCRYKHEARELFTKEGIPQPKSTTVTSFNEAQKIIKEFGLPVCFKSTNNAGSRGFTAMRTEEEITEKAFQNALASGTTNLVIVEELLEAVEDEIAEQSVETLWYDGRMYWLNWVDRMFRQDMELFPEFDASVYKKLPWAVEIGHLNPAVHSIDTTAAVQKMVEQAGRALGVHTQKGGHIMKYDIMLTSAGPYIIEVTPRLSGGWDSSGSTPMRGADFVDGAIEMALGTKITAEVFYKYFAYKYPQIYVAMLSEIPKNAQDCIGRRFAFDRGLNPHEAVANAYKKVIKKQFVI